MSSDKIGGFKTDNFSFLNFLTDGDTTSTGKTTPKQTVQPDDYIVKHGDTLTEIAIKTGQNLPELLKKNPQIKNPNKIYVGQHIETGKQTETYTVKRGDTLSEVAKAHSTSVGDILRANPGQIANRNLIYPGQKLNISAIKQANQPQATKPPTTKPPTTTKPPEMKTPPPTKLQMPVEEKPTTPLKTIRLLRQLQSKRCRTVI